MVEETIRAIRETENQADEIVKAAQEKRLAILEEARVQAEKQRAEILRRAAESAEETERAAQEKSARKSRGAEEELERYVRELKQSVRSGEKNAVDMVLRKLV